MIETLRERGCDGVVLACTEIPLLVAEGESPLPAIDSTRTLARAALRAATSLDVFANQGGKWKLWRQNPRR
jgi:aspartate racemase